MYGPKSTVIPPPSPRRKNSLDNGMNYGRAKHPIVLRSRLWIMNIMETSGESNEDALHSRKHVLLRGVGNGSVSRTDRLNEIQNGNLENIGGRKILENERKRILKQKISKDVTGAGGLHGIRGFDPSNLNFERIRTIEPSRSSLSSTSTPMSANEVDSTRNYAHSTDNLSHAYQNQQQNQTLSNSSVDDGMNNDGVNTHSIKEIIVAGVLIGLIVILLVNMIFMIYEPIAQFVKRKLRRFATKHQILIERRYKTIDRWLIQKVGRFIDTHNT